MGTSSLNQGKIGRSSDQLTDDIANKVATKTYDGIQKVGETIGTIANKADSYNQEVVSYIEKNPVKSLLIAAASGLVLGLIARR